MNPRDDEEITRQYDINYGESVAFRSPWDVYHLKDEKRTYNYSDKHKVHVSLDLTEDNINQAQKIILNLLNKHKVHHFKLGHSVLNKDEARNVHGKELTLYLQLQKDFSFGAKEKKPDFWINLFNELESSLQAANIKPNKQKTQGDKLFPGSNGFIHYRNPENVIDRYVKADSLRNCGFTMNESVVLSDDMTFENFFAGKRLNARDFKEPAMGVLRLPKKQIGLKEKSEDLKQNYDAIIKGFISNINNSSAQDIFFGTSKDSEQLKAPFEDKARLFKLIFGLGFSRDYKSGLGQDFNIEKINNDAKNLRVYFNDCLELAARQVAAIQCSLKDARYSLPETLGDITSAVYYHFFKPIMHVWKSNPEMPFENLVRKENFIKEIVKCSFRDTNVNQLELENPKYICDLDADMIEKMALQASTIKSTVKDQMKLDEDYEHRATSTLTAQPKDATNPLVEKSKNFISTENLNAIEKQLNADCNQWTINRNKQKNGHCDVYKAGVKKFVMCQDKLVTQDQDVETFKKMLISFFILYPLSKEDSRLLNITTTNENLKEKWLIALKAVGGENAIKLAIITVDPSLSQRKLEQQNLHQKPPRPMSF